MTTIDAVLGGTGSGKNVHRQIDELIARRFITKHQMKIGDYLSNGYLLTFPPPPPDPGLPQDDAQGLQRDLGGSHSDGLTLSGTLSDNSFTNPFMKPSASEIQEEEKVSGDEEDFSTESSWLATARPDAALPPCAEDEDFLSEVERLLDGPASQDAASPQDVLFAIKKMGDRIFTSDSFFPDSLTRENVASLPIADTEHQLFWDSRNDEIPNEEW